MPLCLTLTGSVITDNEIGQMNSFGARSLSPRRKFQSGLGGAGGTTTCGRGGVTLGGTTAWRGAIESSMSCSTSTGSPTRCMCVMFNAAGVGAALREQRLS